MAEKRYLVVDLEATCSEDNSVPRDKMETIEIGAVVVNHMMQIEKEYSEFVRPVRTHKLTNFCTNLTTITQSNVDGAALFPEVMGRFASEMWQPDMVFCSWGAYDKGQLIQDCMHHSVRFPLIGEHDHYNIKTAFAASLNVRSCSVQKALSHVGLTFQGTYHRGIDDARNIAKLLPFALGLAS